MNECNIFYRKNKPTFHQIIIGLYIAFFILFPNPVFATTYGSGHYNSGQYGIGEVATPPATSNSSSGSNSSQNSTTPAITPNCEQSLPGTVPQIYAAVSSKSDQITLYFTDSGEPFDHYALTYGLQSGKYSFGSDNIGGHGLRTFTVNSLTANTTYFFKVRAGNGCAAGGWSNEFSAKTVGKVAFRVPAKELEIVSTDVQVTSSAQSASAVHVKVLDPNQLPVQSVQVTIDPKTQTASTDDAGIATFSGIENGVHQLTYAHNDFVGKENIVVQNQDVNVTVTVQEKTSLFSSWRYLILALVGIGIILSGGILFIARRNKNNT